MLRGLLCLILGLLPLGALAALDSQAKIANRTIERVRYLSSPIIGISLPKRDSVAPVCWGPMSFLYMLPSPALSIREVANIFI
jgi:hypothetical protein